DLYGPSRRNSMGVDLSIAAERERLTAAIGRLDAESLEAGPVVAGRMRKDGPGAAVASPADASRTIGRVWSAGPSDIDRAFASAKAAQPRWDARGGEGRAKVLRAMADALEADRERLIAICV